jgi:carboxylate-amine ligase
VRPDELRLDGDLLLHGEHTVHGVYRRTNADMLDSDVGALLGPPARAGTVGVLNAFGSGVGDDKLTHAYVEDMVRFYVGEEPQLRSVPTLDLARRDHLQQALDTFEELVVKPRAGSGGRGVMVCPHADPADVDALREEVRAKPEDWVAQPLVDLSTHPTLIDGSLSPRHVDLRPFVFMHGPDHPRVLPGGLTRFATAEGALVVNSTQDGGFKDTWVLR